MAAILPFLMALAAPLAIETQELAPAAGERRAGFTQMTAPETGVTFRNWLAPESASRNQILLNGSGVAAADVDGDRLPDLFFCSLSGTNRLFRNLGHWRFEEVTAAAGFLPLPQPATGAAFADVDGDGDVDLLVNSLGGGTRLYLNDGRGHFQQSDNCGLRRSGGSTSLAIADIDGDGDLDLYIVNYRPDTIRSSGFPTLNINGRRTIPPEYRDRLEISSQGLVLEHGEPDILYLNDGSGRFREASWTSGVFLDEQGRPLTQPPRDWGLAAMFHDVNKDGAPDLYVCNDFQSPDRLWLNDGRGRFRAASAAVLRSTPTFSMSVDFSDLDGDGQVDFFAADMLERAPHEQLCQVRGREEEDASNVLSRIQVEQNTLQHGRADGTFEEIGSFAGVGATGWTWSAVFLDIDLDGFDDLLLARGSLFNTQDRDANERIERAGPYSRQMIPKKLLMYPPLDLRNGAFRNQGSLMFSEMSKAWGFDQAGVSHGMCLADLDGDGDLDVVLNNLNAPAGLYRNECTAPRVAVRLRGEAGNTRGIGAKIELLGGAAARQSQEMIAGGRYLSGDDAMRTFAAGEGAMQLAVTWRSGNKTLVPNVEKNRLYTLAEAGASNPAPAAEPARKVWFEDVSSLIGHKHREKAFDDFARQGLLPRKFSQLGPGISWIDVNRDGRDDLVVAGTTAGMPGVLLNGPSFQAVTNEPGLQALREQTTVLPAFDGKGTLSLAAGLSHYEENWRGGPAWQQIAIDPFRSIAAFDAAESSSGPLALGDLDGRGELDLFVGGRIVPGRYPEPADSRILRSSSGGFRLDKTNTALLEKAGLVSGATWVDLNNDGFPELVLACEWGPVKIFANDHGKLRDATSAWRMDSKIGWWNGVAAGDFDGDGRMDLFVSNWGLNTRHQVKNGRGPRIYYGPWGAAGEIEPLEAVFDEVLGKWVPERDLNTVGQSMPWIREKFQTHRAYAEAGIEGILGDRLREARVLEANWLETTVFLNRGDHFEAGKLPVEAQFSPAFGVTAADFDGDGHEDVFLSQNFFAVRPEDVRSDAGRGLLLRGDGRGGFSKVDGSESGIKIYGEQRGSAAADYDGDGRPDLAVAQNGAATILLHNTIARPGLRLRLTGPPGNPLGLGAIVRASSGGKWSPARSVSGGGGYWSLDSATLVFPAPEPLKTIEVLWPGGQREEFAVPAAAREVEVNKSTGRVKVLR